MASVTLGLTAILVLFGLVALWTVHESTEAAYRERVSLAWALATRVDDALELAFSALEREAAEIGVRPGMLFGEGQRRRLATLRHAGHFAALAVVDRAGTTLWSDPSEDGWPAGRPGGHPGVQRLFLSGQRQIAELAAPGATSGCLAVPVRNADGHVVGALVAQIDPRYPALDILPTVGTGNRMQVQLLSQRGQLLAGSGDSRPGSAAEHAQLLADLMEAGATGYRVHQPAAVEGVGHVVAYAPLALMPSWGIAVEQPADVVLAAPRQLEQRLALLGISALLLAIGTTWLDVRRVVRPLRDLTAAAERFAAGHLDEPLRVDRSDELGVLARAFDRMRQRLRASLAEVAEWNRSALLNPDHVIALVTRKALDLVGGDVAGLGLVGAGGDGLVWRRLDGAAAGRIRFSWVEQTARLAVRAASPQVVPDRRQVAPEGPAGRPNGLRAALAVPLQSGGHTLGVLLVANRAPMAFSEEQVQLLSTLANQAAVALDNARLYERVQSLAVFEERERIAREMHDGLGQVLGYVNTKTLAVARLLEVGKVDEARVHVAQLEAAAKEVYGDVREAILGLRTTLSPEQDFLSALREYLGGFEQQSGISVELRAPAARSELGLAFAAEMQLLRIVQEALANVRKHARASRATVELSPEGGVVRLLIRDDGRGFDSAGLAREGWPRFGLQTMRERAEATGGSFSITSRPGNGTTVEIVIPRLLPREAEDGAEACAVSR